MTVTDVGTLLLHDTSQRDRFELQRDAPEGLVRVADPEVDPTEHGEFLTATVVVILTISALKVLASWLSKTRERETLVYTATVTTSDGRTATREIRWDRSRATAPSAEQLKALGAMLDVDVTALPA